MTSSTVSSESAPRSSTNEDSFLMSPSLTPNCSATIFLTRCSMFSMYYSFPDCLGVSTKLAHFTKNEPAALLQRQNSTHIHAAINMQFRAGNVARLRRGEKSH